MAKSGSANELGCGPPVILLSVYIHTIVNTFLSDESELIHHRRQRLKRRPFDDGESSLEPPAIRQVERSLELLVNESGSDTC